MSFTANAKTFTQNGGTATFSNFLGPAHTQSVLDDIRLGLTVAKPTTVFSGVGRFSIKLTRTCTLTGALTTVGNLIIDIGSSIPIGVAGADVDAALNDLGALLSSATGKTMFKNQQISW